MTDDKPALAGIYLVNATGDIHPLVTEDGSGDEALLREALADHGVDVVEPIRDPDGRVVGATGEPDPGVYIDGDDVVIVGENIHFEQADGDGKTTVDDFETTGGDEIGRAHV